MISEASIEKALDFLRDNAALVGQLYGQKAYLEHAMKIGLAQAYLDAKGTVAERDAMSRLDDNYKELVNEYRDCVTELHTVQTTLKAAEARIEVWRSQNANQRRGHL